MDAGQAPGAESKSPQTVISDRYILRSALGHGAFASTFLAEDRSRHTPVVIKLLDAGERGAVVLFQREAQVTGSLSHPNIVKILDCGFAKDGRPYFVSEWVDGQDLGEVIRIAGPLGTNRSLQIATGIAETLDYIHSRRFVHRDLKPSNVLIPGWPNTPDYRNPKLLDFGVAGALSGGLTQSGMVFGTPRYMSPEQVLGQAQSAATDVYGWGLLLFEMLAGRALRGGAGTAESLFRAILEEEIPERELQAVPPYCAVLIRKCVCRDPAQRPSIDVVINDLKRLQAIAIVPPEVPFKKTEGLPVQSPMPGHRRLIWVALAGSVCIAFVLAFVPFHGALRGIASLGGLLLAEASIAGGFWLRGWLGRRSSVKEQAYDLALGAKSRANLTATIALQLDDLVGRLRGLDERILAGTVALMLDEYGKATDAKDRQSALMNVVALSEKLAQRLSPWYVRYKDAIASAVAVVGAASGLIATISALHGPHKP